MQLTSYRTHRNATKPHAAFLSGVHAMVISAVLSSTAVAHAASAGSAPAAPGFTAREGPNAPMGTPAGLFPGRVVWVRDPASTDWDGTSGHWWDDTHTNQEVVSRMFATMIARYSGTNHPREGWVAMFRHFNRTHARGDVGYQRGERIAIKINCNHDKTSYEWDNEAHPSPAVVYALVAQLIEVVGVPGDAITITDPSQLVGAPIYEKIRRNPNPEFQKVWFADRCIAPAPQRVYPEPDRDSGVYFPIPPTNKLVRYFVPKCFTEATYIVNLAILRRHRAFGVTMGAKNHFGSIYSTDLDKYAPGKPGSNVAGRPSQTPLLHNYSMWDYAVSNKAGDPHCAPILLAHPDLGGKELVEILDGIFPTQTNERNVIRWQSLGNQWCASLLMAQDPVALQSVGLDLLSNEPNVTAGNPSFTPDLDNFLHECALADHPPSGYHYDPANNGRGIPHSLGVHEHWNNPQERKYSRNLGRDVGIELIRVNAP